jgi:hypothetical protein
LSTTTCLRRLRGAGGHKEFIPQRVRNSGLSFGVIPVGTALGHWISRLIAVGQLKKLTGKP